MRINRTVSATREDQQVIDDLALNNDELTDELLDLVVGGLPKNKEDDRSKGCTEAGGGIWDPYLSSVDN